MYWGLRLAQPVCKALFSQKMVLHHFTHHSTFSCAKMPIRGESSEAVTSRHATGETFTQTEFYQKFSILRSIKF
jgi:hypothetical protein